MLYPGTAYHMGIIIDDAERIQINGKSNMKCMKEERSSITLKNETVSHFVLIGRRIRFPVLPKETKYNSV